MIPHDKICHKALIKRQCKAMPNETNNEQNRTYSPEIDLLCKNYAF